MDDIYTLCVNLEDNKPRITITFIEMDEGETDKLIGRQYEQAGCNCICFTEIILMLINKLCLLPNRPITVVEV